MSFTIMTPSEQLNLILGKLLKEKGGEEYIKQLCKEYKTGEERERFDRSRLKEMLLKALKATESYK